MIDPEADRRIKELEQELAQIQTDTTYRQIEANLARELLRETLDIAMRTIDGMAAAMDANLQQMANDLNGGHDD